MSVTVGSVTGSSFSSGSVTGGSIGLMDNPFAANVLAHYPLATNLNDVEGGSAGTLTRASTGWYLPSNSTEASEASNVARYAEGRLYLEGASTNYALYSTDLSNAAWTKTRVTATGGQADPAGGTDAYLITVTSDAAYAAVDQVIAGLTANSMGVWLKAGTTTEATLGGLASGSPSLAESVTLSTEWTYYARHLSSTSDQFAVFPHHGGVAGGGTVGDTIYVYNPQLQDKNQTYSPIVTAATAVTRTTDEGVFPNGVAPEPTNDFGFAFTFCDFGHVGTAQKLFQFQGETGSRRAVTNAGTGLLRTTYGSNFIDTTMDVTDGVTRRYLLTGDASNFKVYIDGVLQNTAAIASASGTHTTLDLNPSGNAYYRVKNVIHYNKYFSDAADAVQETVNA